MIQVLDLADKDLKITVTNMLNKIKEKMDNIDEMLENSTIELKSMKNKEFLYQERFGPGNMIRFSICIIF